MDPLEYVESVDRWDSGGGTTLDLVRLTDGTILAVNGESIVLYANEDDLLGGDEVERPVIQRPLPKEP